MSLQSIKATLSSIEGKFRATEEFLVSIVTANKSLIVVGLVAIPLLILKFRSMIVDMLLASAKKNLADATAKSTALQAKETAENAQADAIIKAAATTRTTEQAQPVPDDWYKSDGKDETEH